jgi:hypothetical protein
VLTVWLARLPPPQARHSAADARQALFRNSGPSIAPYVPLGLTHPQAPVCARDDVSWLSSRHVLLSSRGLTVQ